MVPYWSHFDHFEPPWSSQKLSGRPPKACLDTNRRPKPSPKRNPPFSYGKTTHLEDLGGHHRTPNKPQPPPPVKLSFDSAPYTSACKRPNSPTPRVGGFLGFHSRGLRPLPPTPKREVVAQRILRCGKRNTQALYWFRLPDSFEMRFETTRFVYFVKLKHASHTFFDLKLQRTAFHSKNTTKSAPRAPRELAKRLQSASGSHPETS